MKVERGLAGPRPERRDRLLKRRALGLGVIVPAFELSICRIPASEIPQHRLHHSRCPWGSREAHISVPGSPVGALHVISRSKKVRTTIPDPAAESSRAFVEE